MGQVLKTYLSTSSASLGRACRHVSLRMVEPSMKSPPQYQSAAALPSSVRLVLVASRQGEAVYSLPETSALAGAFPSWEVL